MELTARTLGKCDHCLRTRETFANRGERLCFPCLSASVDDQLKHEGVRVIEDGRETVYRLGYITPRAQRF